MVRSRDGVSSSWIHSYTAVVAQASALVTDDTDIPTRRAGQHQGAFGVARSLSADLRELHKRSVPACAVVLGGGLFHGGRALTHGEWPVLAVDLALITATTVCIAFYVRWLSSGRARRVISGTVIATVFLTILALAATTHALSSGRFSLPLAVAAVALMIAVAGAVFRLMYVLAAEGD